MYTLQDEEKHLLRKHILFDDPPKAGEEFQAFFRLYDSIIRPASAGGAIIQVDSPVLNSLADILKCIRHIRENSTLTRDCMAHAVFPEVQAPISDKEDALQSLLRVSFMLNCSLKDKYSQEFEVGGYIPARWEANESLVDYVERALPKDDTQAAKKFRPQRYKKELKAWKLKRRYKLKFRPTDNIMHFQDRSISLEAFESLKQGTLPPQLLLETLHSFHFILFSISVDRSGKSRILLRDLICKHRFDPDGKWDEGCIRDLPKDFTYQYWGHRLEKLRDIVSDPPPGNRIVSWIERHTSERNALTVAIVGLFLSAFFGLLSCIIGAAQLWVAINAWKSPQPLPST